MTPASMDAPPASRWADYAPASWAEDFAFFARTYCVQTVDRFAGEPLELEDWQREIMGEVLACDEAGVHYWRSAAIVLPRKNGKTTMLSALATYHLLNAPGQPEVLLAASSDAQAGRLFDGVVSFIRAAPALFDLVVLRESIGEIARVDGGGVIRRVASDPNRLHGYNPSLVIADEVAQWTKPSLERAWTALTTAGGARASSQVVTISTAGEARDRETGILGRLIDRNEKDGDVERPDDALTISRNHAAGTLIYNYSAPTTDRRDVEALKKANPASWIDDDYLRRQAANPELSDADVLQLHGNVWAASRDSFIDPERWDGLADGARDLLAGGPLELSLGIDGSRVYDTTVVGWAHTADDGRIDVGARIFSARREAPAHVFHQGGRIDFDDVEGLILGLFADHTVREVAFDPRYVDRSADILEARLPGARIFPVEPQSAHARDSLAAFYRGIVEGTVRHGGDPAIRAHVLAAVAEWDERGPRVRKLAKPDPIDALVAMSLAYWRESRRSKRSAWAGSW